MIYAVFFKYKSLISIRSVILNKRIALVNSLQLDSSLHNHQLYINNYGNLIVYVANDKAIVKFSPLSVAAFHSSLQLQTSARSSTDDVPHPLTLYLERGHTLMRLTPGFYFRGQSLQSSR